MLAAHKEVRFPPTGKPKTPLIPMHDSRLSPSPTTASGKSGSPARRGRPLGNHEEKRAELLKAVVAVVAQEGYIGTSMRRVAQYANCTTGAVTYYFANKEEMLAAAAQDLFDQFDAVLEREAAKPRVDIKTIISSWLSWGKGGDTNALLAALFHLLTHARHEQALADIFQQRYCRFRQSFAAMLAKGQAQGDIRDDIDAELLADQICAMGDGWKMVQPVEPERFAPERQEALLDAVVMLVAPYRPRPQ
ncbi:TetR/AcrR family transcriptional regulator [Pseudomonas sp. R26(2017)]